MTETLLSNEENLDTEKEQSLDTTTTTTPRSVIIVPKSKSQARVTPTSIPETAGDVLEKHLPNGDLYIGTFSNNTPHGSGKYLWSDGCMYEGEWRKGKANGKGKFSWPSGATYEGEFKSGRMDGTGTFIGPDGDTYRGSWAGDRKHGYGVKCYSNGDLYEGNWRKNLQEGKGRYVWRNGNEYVGEWRNGMIHGTGVLAWSNGNRYDGNWECGMPKGHGVFTWPDGSCYVGCLSSDPLCKGRSKDGKDRILNGTFYPGKNGGGQDEGLEGDFSRKLCAPLMMVGEEGVDLVIGGAVGGEGGKKGSDVDCGVADRAFPRICIWESDGEAGDITCDIVDNVEASMLYRDGFMLDRDMIKQFRRNPCGEVKRPGQTISEGHKNYDLMLNLQLGIR